MYPTRHVLRTMRHPYYIHHRPYMQLGFRRQDLQDPQSQSFAGGKHRGKKMSELLAEDPSHCQWILREAQAWGFAAVVRSRRLFGGGHPKPNTLNDYITRRSTVADVQALLCKQSHRGSEWSMVNNSYRVRACATAKTEQMPLDLCTLRQCS